MIIQRVNVFSTKNVTSSADKLSKINLSKNTLKSLNNDKFTTKMDGYTEEEIWSGPVGFVC